jgi:hypothetical protein
VAAEVVGAGAITDCVGAAQAASSMEKATNRAMIRYSFVELVFTFVYIYNFLLLDIIHLVIYTQ